MTFGVKVGFAELDRRRIFVGNLEVICRQPIPLRIGVVRFQSLFAGATLHLDASFLDSVGGGLVQLDGTLGYVRLGDGVQLQVVLEGHRHSLSVDQLDVVAGVHTRVPEEGMRLLDVFLRHLLGFGGGLSSGCLRFYLLDSDVSCTQA